MKKNLSFFILFSLLISNAYAQTQAAVVDSFKSVVNTVASDFKNRPPSLISQDYKKSPSGKIYYQLKFDLVDEKFDVQSTNSLVSPYTGYIIITLKTTSNAHSGDIAGHNGNIGFSDLEKAKLNDHFESCTDTISNFNEWCIGDIKINYAFQDGKWIFKNIDTETLHKIQDGGVRYDIQTGILDSTFNFNNR